MLNVAYTGEELLILSVLRAVVPEVAVNNSPLWSLKDCTLSVAVFAYVATILIVPGYKSALAKFAVKQAPTKPDVKPCTRYFCLPFWRTIKPASLSANTKLVFVALAKLFAANVANVALAFAMSVI